MATTTNENGIVKGETPLTESPVNVPGTIKINNLVFMDVPRVQSNMERKRTPETTTINDRVTAIKVNLLRGFFSIETISRTDEAVTRFIVAVGNDSTDDREQVQIDYADLDRIIDVCTRIKDAHRQDNETEITGAMLKKGRADAYRALFDYAENLKKSGYHSPADISQFVNEIGNEVRVQFSN